MFYALNIVPVLLYIHRAYSCRAATEMPLNPLKHRFGPSVLATYKCGTAVTETVTDALELLPNLVPRFIGFYSFAFSAAAALATLVIFAPQWGHASKVLMHLDRLCTFFESAKLTTVVKLQGKALY